MVRRRYLAGRFLLIAFSVVIAFVLTPAGRTISSGYAAKKAAEEFLENLCRGDFHQAFDYVAYYDINPDLEPTTPTDQARETWVGRMNTLRRKGIAVKSYSGLRTWLDGGQPRGTVTLTVAEHGKEAAFHYSIRFSNSRSRWKVQELISGGTAYYDPLYGMMKGVKSPVSREEQKRIDLYLDAMKAAYQIENGGNRFIAVKTETLEGLSEKGKQMVLEGLEGVSHYVCSYEENKDNPALFIFDERGRRVGTREGTVLSIHVQEYRGDEAQIVAESWFGSLGAVLPEYEAGYADGIWRLKLIRMAVS